MGYEYPREIQQRTMPALLKTNKSSLIQSNSGNGKSAIAYISVLQKMRNVDNASDKAVFVYGSQQLAIDQYVQFSRFCDGYKQNTKHTLFLAKNKEQEYLLEEHLNKQTP